LFKICLLFFLAFDLVVFNENLDIFDSL
jgi:hypothetical protein